MADLARIGLRARYSGSRDLGAAERLVRITPGRAALKLGTAVMAFCATQAWAQTQEPASAPTINEDVTEAAAEQGKTPDEIVVTGTLLRNVAPAGAQSIAVNEAAIEATGATSTAQLLATIPQLSSFGALQVVNNGGTQLTVNRTNLRGLPQSTGGSSPTLILMDGHRLIGEGVKQSYPDPDVIPPALIQRVEILTDGGSASYGSDAVGGVINFITKSRFDGIEIGVRQGFADSYMMTDVNVTAGTSWDTGSVFVGYNFARHDAIFGRDRDYVRHINYTTNLPTDLGCARANVSQGGQIFAVNNGNSLTLSNANLCDRSDNSSFYPEEARHSVMAGFRQQLTDSLEFEIKGYFSDRKNISYGGPRAATATVSSDPASANFSPFYISTGGGNTANQTINFDFGPAGDSASVRTHLWALGITPSLTWKIGGDWQAKAYYNYGKSRTTADNPVVNTGILAGLIKSGAINPYNVGTSSPTAIAQVLDRTDAGVGEDEMHNAKVVVDGPLFGLPGGELRVAVGAEFLHEKFAGFFKTDSYANIAVAPLFPAERNVWSAFGELNIPLVGPENDVPLVSSLTVAASVRYDHYSDFGSNWAPNVGVTWKPVDWVGIRARWNKSFQAPSLVQLSQAQSPNLGVFSANLIPFVPLLANPAVPPNGGPIIAIQGTVLPLEPQRARDYNLGFDISPPFIPGLNLHFTYFNIDYRGQIAGPPLGSGPFYNVAGFQSLFIMLPTNDQVRAFLSARGFSTADIENIAIAGINNSGNSAYVVADVRARNLGITKLNGFDFGFNYHRPVSFGSIDLSYSGSYTNSILAAADGVTFLPNLAGIDASRFNSVARAGVNIGDNFRSLLTWNHIAGIRLSVPAALNQTTVGSYDTFDLFMQYNLKQGSLPPIELSLGVYNLFDTDPPLYRGVAAGTAGGYFNGSTRGRLFQLGATIKF